MLLNIVARVNRMLLSVERKLLFIVYQRNELIILSKRHSLRARTDWVLLVQVLSAVKQLLASGC